ncbi:cytochrome P450 [Williamsia sp. CHRR-6]|nr:cytochrome P450 [Williamsia sp. CHRR-6]
MKRATKCPFDPPPELQALQDETRVAAVELPDGRQARLLTRYDDQRAILNDPRVSSDVTMVGHPNHVPTGNAPLSFLFMDDPEHARMRRMVTAPFMIKRIRAMRPAVQRIVDEQIDSLLAGPKPVDLVQAFTLPVPSLVISDLLGVPYNDHELFQHNSQTIIKRTSTPEQRRQAQHALLEYLTSLVEAKIAEPADDVISQLGKRVTSGELTTKNAAEVGVLLLLAGHETTANMMALGTAVLLQHPDQLALLQAEDNADVVPSAVEELLRYLTITHNARRRVATEDIDIADTTIREGEGVLMPADIANRDPEVFDNADTLDLRRDARGHVAFGFGPHQCLGQPLARLELEVVYGTLYRRIPTLKLATDVEKLPFKHDGAVYGVYELPVTW